MQVPESNIVEKKKFLETASLSRVVEGPFSAGADSQTAFDGDLLLNEENANRRLQYLDQMIANASGESADFEVFGCTIEKLALHIYLGNTSETVACLRELNELDDTQSSSEDEDELSIEGETAQILLAWAADGDASEVIELAKFPDAISLLLLKAKGIQLPEPADFSVEDSFPGDEELEEQLFSRNYQEALKILEEQLNDASELDRELLLQTRGFCKAMLGDYEAALQDYNLVINFDPNFDVDELPLIRGLIHFLNNDLEKARADLFPPCKEGITLNEYTREFLELDNFSGFAIAKILNL